MLSGSCRRLVLFAAAAASAVWLGACDSDGGSTEVCVQGDGKLKVGFYAFFAPVSYSADEEPGAAGFDTHRGYEADLLSALEATEGTGASFSRRGIAVWDGIWLLSAEPEFDLIGGGITILDSRTRDSEGGEAVVFTSGHITFRQSLLVRAGEEDRFTSYDDLVSDIRVGALANTTGEARLLEITGLTNADGILAAGTSIETPQGTVVADGSSDYFITAAGESELLAERSLLLPPSDDLPQVVYLGDKTGEAELLAALSDGTIDALARGEIGNRDAVHASDGAFAVALLDDAIELGGFTLDRDDADLASCLSERIDHLTDGMKIGYAEWVEDRSVFMSRAATWEGSGRPTAP